VLSLSKRWAKPCEDYLKWFAQKEGFGEVQFVDAKNDMCVANMIAQRDNWLKRCAADTV
jgi:hypothetical protein